MKSIAEMRDELQSFCDMHYKCEGDCCQCKNHLCPFYSIRCADEETIAVWHKEHFPEQYVTETDFIADSVNDPVNHPSHYTKGKIEVADFIADQKLNFDRGNAVKYVCRAGSKDPEKEVQDLEKAIWYINHEIKTLKGECENGTAEKEN